MLTDRLYILLGRNIRKKREQLNYSQEQLAQSVGISRASITNIEIGRQKTSLSSLYKIARSLSVSPQELLPEMKTLSKEANNDLPKALRDIIRNKIQEVKK